jgi:uncharacterized protein
MLDSKNKIVSSLPVAQYLEALKTNRLLGLKCSSCGSITAPPRLACRECGSLDNEVVELTGKGSITTFTSIYIGVENRKGKTPYLVVMVKLDEGPWIMGNLEGTDPAKADMSLIDKRVVMKNPVRDKVPLQDIAPVFYLEN